MTDIEGNRRPGDPYHEPFPGAWDKIFSKVEEDGLGREVEVVPNLDNHPYADNQRHDPGIYPQDSGGRVLVVRPAGPEKPLMDHEGSKEGRRDIQWPH